MRLRDTNSANLHYQPVKKSMSGGHSLPRERTLKEKRMTGPS